MKRTSHREIAPGAFIPAGFAVLSSTMFKFACEMSKQRDSSASLPKLAFPMAAVIHAAASLEAFLNEQLEMILTTWGNDWESTVESLERLDLPKKWIVFPRLLHGRTFNVGEEPYQSFCGLVDLRNALMHYRPVATAELYVPKKVDSLRNKFEFDSHENQDWTSKVLTQSCARWACTTAHDMVRKYYDISRQSNVWSVEEKFGWQLCIDG